MLLLVVGVLIPISVTAQLPPPDGIDPEAAPASPPMEQGAAPSVPAGQGWFTGAPAPTERYRAAGIEDPDQCTLYVIAGLNGVPLSANERYDPASNTWTTLAPKPRAAANVQAAWLNGRVYIAGGYDGALYLSWLDIYDVTSDTWSMGADLPVTLSGAAMESDGSFVYTFGGNDGTGGVATVYRYDPAQNSWTTVAPMPGTMRYAAAESLNGKIYVCGGWPAETACYEYTPATNTWATIASMGTGRQSPGLEAGSDGCLHAFGGGNSWTPISSVERWCGTSWTTLPNSMPTGRIGMATGFLKSAQLDAQGALYAVTGFPVSPTNQYLEYALSDPCAFTEPQVLLTPEYQAGQGCPGTGQPYGLNLLNQAGQADTFDIMVSSTWLVECPATLGPIADGSSLDFQCTVAVACSAQAGDSDDVVVTATGQDSGLAANATIHQEASAGCPPCRKPVHTCIPADTAPFAFVNQPWDWLEGVVDPDATVQATLKRGGSPIASVSTVADSTGWFSLEFLDQGSHVDILVGDEVEVSGGGLGATIAIPEIVGSLDVTTDSVAGQVSGASLPALGDVCVRLPADLNFVAGKTWFDSTGRFGVAFGGQLDIGYDHLAQVVYEDPNGNYVVQLLYPEGLNPRALIDESRIEGVTTPNSQITVLAWDINGAKGQAETTADDTGYYSTGVFTDGQKVSFALGDHVAVIKPGHVREMILNMRHVSYALPWNEMVYGTVYGMSLPAEGAQGRVDVWSPTEKRWYTQYVWIGPGGQYGADFSNIVDITAATMIRVWATADDGSQQAALGWGLDLGTSIADDRVWGYTTIDTTAVITVYDHLESSVPVGVLGTATVLADATGFFSTTVLSNGLTVDIAPSQVVVARAGEYRQELFVGFVGMEASAAADRLSLTGPRGAVVHVEGRHPGNGPAGAPQQTGTVWREVTLDSDGKAEVDLAPFDLQPGDLFDLTFYPVEQGLAIHTREVVPTELPFHIYLPLIVRNSG